MRYEDFDFRPIEEMTADLHRHLGPELARDRDLAVDLYRALCNTVWSKGDHHYSFTWRGAGGAVAWIRSASGCPREDYLDFYISGDEGECRPEIRSRLEALGYTPTPI